MLPGSDPIAVLHEQPDLSANIFAAMQRAGKDLNTLTPNDLAPFEEFHLRGRAAAMGLASAAGLHNGMAVLDAGSVPLPLAGVD